MTFTFHAYFRARNGSARLHCANTVGLPSTTDKIPAASIVNPTTEAENIQVTVSPKGSPRSAEEEIHALRTRNKVLSDTLKAIKRAAEEQAEKNYDLVWFARNRSEYNERKHVRRNDWQKQTSHNDPPTSVAGRYPLHKDRLRIERQHSDELEKLQTPDADYHHGVHAGLLAASRMFKAHADILHINEHDELSSDMMSAAAKHKEVIAESRKSFPKVDVDAPPSSR